MRAFVAVALALALALAAAGWSVLPLLVIAALPWFWFTSVRLGAPGALAVTTITAGWVVLMALIALPMTGLPLRESFGALATLIAIGGVLALRRLHGHPTARHRIAPATLAPTLGSLIVAIAAAVTMAGAGGSRYAWAMRGDAATNILFARAVLADNGITLGPGQNPVPLPAGLIALAMAAEERLADDAGEAIRSDITALTAVWFLAIGFSCLLAGVVAAGAVPAAHPVIRALTGAVVSLLPLAWFVSGFATEAGYLNVPLALIVLLASVTAARCALRAPHVALGTLALACTVLLAVWAPLAVIPLALASLVMLRNQQALLALRGMRLTVLIAAAVQLVVFGMLVSVPSLLAQSEFVTIMSGPRLPVAQWYLLVVVAIAVTAMVARARAAGLDAAVLGIVLGASVITTGGMLFANRYAASIWAYYPSKFAWIAGITVLIVSLGLCAAAMAQLPWRPRVRGAALASVGVVAAGAVLAAPLTMTFEQRPNIVSARSTDRMLLGGDEAAESVFRLASAQPTVLLRSGRADEPAVSFWLLQMATASVREDVGVHTLAYIVLLGDGLTVDELCSLDPAITSSLVVLTADAALDSHVAAACDTARPTVRLVDDTP